MKLPTCQLKAFWSEASLGKSKIKIWSRQSFDCFGIRN